MKNCHSKSALWSAFMGLLMLFATQAQAQMVPHLSFKSNWNGHKGSEPYNSLWGWSGGGHDYAILGSIDSIYFFDVTDVLHTRLCASRAGRSANCLNREFKTYQHYCYAIGDQGQSSLQIFDLKYLPDSVHKVYDTDTLCEDAHNLFFDNGRLYLAFNKHIRKKDSIVIQSAMTVASVVNPEIPVFIADLKPGFHYIQGVKHFDFETVHDMFVRNDTAYCSVGNEGMFIYNYKDPYNPQLITSFTADANDGFNHSNWLSADGNFLVNTIETPGKPMTLFDASQIKDSTNMNISMERLCTFDSHASQGSTGHNAFIKDKFIYTSYYEDGVVVFDMSDPNHVKEVASYDTHPQNQPGHYSGFHGCWNVYPYFTSCTIIASDMSNGLFVFKLDSVSTINNKYISDNDLDIKILGNPFSNEIRLLASSKAGGEVQISLYDMLGRVLYTAPQRLSAEPGIISIPYTGVKNTEILLSISSKNGVYTRKLLQQE